MGLSPKSNYRFFFVSCFDIGEVPRSPWKWNWNLLYFLPFIFTFEQCAVSIGFSMETNDKGADNSFPGNIMKNKFYQQTFQGIQSFLGTSYKTSLSIKRD